MDFVVLVQEVEAGAGEGGLAPAEVGLHGQHQQRVALVAGAAEDAQAAGYDGLRELGQADHVVVGAGQVGRRRHRLGRDGGDPDVGGQGAPRGVEVVVGPRLHVCAGDGDGGGFLLSRHLGSPLLAEGTPVLLI